MVLGDSFSIVMFGHNCGLAKGCVICKKSQSFSCRKHWGPVRLFQIMTGIYCTLSLLSSPLPSSLFCASCSLSPLLCFFCLAHWKCSFSLLGQSLVYKAQDSLNINCFSASLLRCVQRRTSIINVPKNFIHTHSQLLFHMYILPMYN